MDEFFFYDPNWIEVDISSVRIFKTGDQIWYRGDPYIVVKIVNINKMILKRRKE